MAEKKDRALQPKKLIRPSVRPSIADPRIIENGRKYVDKFRAVYPRCISHK